MEIKRILVPLDGSKPSFKASIHAIDLAKKFDAELIALHVTDPRYKELVMAISPKSARSREIKTKIREEGEKIVDKVRQDAAQKVGNIRTDVIDGYTSAVSDIVGYAKANNVELIVIGSRGLTGFKKLLVGSVASGVLTYAHCPVLIVK
ncbi:MAG TPA: universal stress protein [Nitrososphaeraceae archaeon]|nr:universal stress protein [Nitrososphaeraceae archaeon]